MKPLRAITHFTLRANEYERGKLARETTREVVQRPFGERCARSVTYRNRRRINLKKKTGIIGRGRERGEERATPACVRRAETTYRFELIHPPRPAVRREERDR